MHHLPLRLLEVPLSELVGAYEAVRGANVNLGEEIDDAMRDVETVLVVDVVLGVGEVLPVRLGLHGRGGIAATDVGEEVGSLPLAVLPAAFDVRDDWVEGDPAVVGGGWGGEGERGPKLEAAVRAVRAAGGQR